VAVRIGNGRYRLYNALSPLSGTIENREKSTISTYFLALCRMKVLLSES